MNTKPQITSGAMISLSADDVLMSQGEVLRFNKPQPGKYNYYSPDFFGQDQQPWHVFSENLMINKTTLENVTSSPSEKLFKAHQWTSPNKEDFGKKFLKIKKLMAQGELEKIVPVVFESLPVGLCQESLEFILQNAFNNSGQQMVYGLWGQDLNCSLLGVTPEILFSYSPKSLTLSTMALAGTHSIEKEKDSLLENKKERHEHQLVVQSLQKTLGNLGSLRTSAPYEWELLSLKHLRTDITVVLNQMIDIERLILKLHPTPALGVSPSSFGWKKLMQFESQLPRQKYGAPFGVQLPSGGFKCLVAIRNIQWLENQILLGSGCGIVRESELETEWNELVLKRKSVKRLLGLLDC